MVLDWSILYILSIVGSWDSDARKLGFFFGSTCNSLWGYVSNRDTKGKSKVVKLKDGCYLHSECTSCPYDRCKDDKRGIRECIVSRETVIKEYNEGFTVKQIAKKHKTTEFTIWSKINGYRRINCKPRKGIIFRLIRNNRNELVVCENGHYFNPEKKLFEVVGKVTDIIPLR